MDVKVYFILFFVLFIIFNSISFKVGESVRVHDVKIEWIILLHQTVDKNGDRLVDM